MTCGDSSVVVPCVVSVASCPNTLAFLQGFLDGTIAQQTPNYVLGPSTFAGACSPTANGYNAWQSYSDGGDVNCDYSFFITDLGFTSLSVFCIDNNLPFPESDAFYDQPDQDVDPPMTAAETFQCVSDVAALLPKPGPALFNWSVCGL